MGYVLILFAVWLCFAAFFHALVHADRARAKLAYNYGPALSLLVLATIAVLASIALTIHHVPYTW